MYKILARKYRPGRFSEVVEQDHVTLTLMRSIKMDKIGHAYLFSGPRGVGKTTIARVLVKTLNCEQRNDTDLSCCGTCQFCIEVDKGVSLDYQEIDGASHRGIDQIREIKNNLPYASANQKYRVFVIDEAHMLTPEAFNAMLKSLEEPPSKVIFILCTTESGKIPLTIRSRCQHFRFKLVSLKKLKDILATITTKENIRIDDGALFYIAKHAAGSIRDAQNLLEQVAAYAGEDISQDKVLAALGEVSKQILYDFVSQLELEALPKNYLLVEHLIEQGGSFTTFLYELVALFSAFIYLQEGLKETHMLHMSPEDIKLFYDLSHRFERYELYKLLDCLFEFLQELKHTTEEKTIRNLALIKLHRYKSLITNEEIRSSLNLLAKASDLTDGESTPPPSPPPSLPLTSSPTTTPKTLKPLKPPPPPQSPPEAHTNPQSSPTYDMEAPPKEHPRPQPSHSAAPSKKPNPRNPLAPLPPPQPHPSPSEHHGHNTTKHSQQKEPSSQPHPSLQAHQPKKSNHGRGLIIKEWNESAYRSLMRWASQTEHAIYEKLNKLQFDRYDSDGTLHLLETTSMDAKALGGAFEQELIAYLQTLSHQKAATIQPMIQALTITPSTLLKNTQNVIDIFKDAKVVNE